MALVKCPECGREVSDSAIQCPNCGYSVKEHFEREKRNKQYEDEAKAEAYAYVKMITEKRRIEAEKVKKRIANEAIEKERQKKEQEEREKRAAELKKKIKVIVPVIVMTISVIVGGILYYNKVVKPSRDYTIAMKYVENKEYDKAIEKFVDLDNYKDSKIMLIEAYIEQGIKEITNDNFTEARRIFKKVSNESIYVDKIDTLLIAEGKKYAALGEESKANQCFNELSDRKKYFTQIEDAYYEAGIIALKNQEIGIAKTNFLKIKDFSKHSEELRALYIESLESCQEWEDVNDLIELSKKLSSKFEIVDDNVNEKIISTIDKFFNNAISKNEKEAVRKILMVKLSYTNKQGHISQDDIEFAYKMGVEYFESKNYEKAKAVLEEIKETKYQETQVYLEAISAIGKLQADTISLSAIQTLSRQKMTYVPSDLKLKLIEANNYYKQMEGAYNNHYYYYINDYKVYWGDSTACVDISASYDFDNKHLIISGLGSDGLKIIGSGIKDNFRVYEKISTSKLPSTFDKCFN